MPMMRFFDEEIQSRFFTLLLNFAHYCILVDPFDQTGPFFACRFWANCSLHFIFSLSTLAVDLGCSSDSHRDSEQLFLRWCWFFSSQHCYQSLRTLPRDFGISWMLLLWLWCRFHHKGFLDQSILSYWNRSASHFRLLLFWSLF